MADDRDIASMATVVRDAMGAGAFGFSTSRTIAHTSVDGRPVPGTFAQVGELRALAQAVVDGGPGLLGVARPPSKEGTPSFWPTWTC
jgi:N-acyl-D-aspartate/D-glutamate deacylase